MGTTYSISKIKIFIKQEVKRALTEELLKYGFNRENEKIIKEKIYVPMKVVTQALKITKTTMHNWRKHKNTKTIIEGYIQKTGRNVGYDIEGIKELLRRYPTMFSRGRSYNYQEEVMSEEVRKTRVISTLHNKLMDEELHEEEIDYFSKFGTIDLGDEDDNISVADFKK